jgi:hypothetical protein
MSLLVQILGQQMEIERMISEYESFTSDLLAWIEQVKQVFIFMAYKYFFCFNQHVPKESP